MTTHNTPTSDRIAMMGWLFLLAVAVTLMFFGTLALISLLPGVDTTALYAPITTLVWGSGGQVVTGVALTIAFVVAWRGIAPAVRTHFSPAHRADRKQYVTAIAERNEALTRTKVAEQQGLHATQKADALVTAITEDYATLYGDTSSLTPTAMLATMRVELLSLRPVVEQTNSVVRERDELRTQVTDLLNRPVPTPITWAQLLPLVEYTGSARSLTVKGLRDEVRKLTRIPEGEYDTFSAAVRALSAYSPSKRVVKVGNGLSVEGGISPQNTPTHGRNTGATDGQPHSRTLRKPRTKRLPTATARQKVEVTP